MGGMSGANRGRSGGRRTGGKFRPMAEMNVIPMNDVMLVLLVVTLPALPYSEKALVEEVLRRTSSPSARKACSEERLCKAVGYG